MKKVTKFLIGAGIGYLVGKFIKNHLKIEINIDVKNPDKPIEDEKTKELYDEALEKMVENGDKICDLIMDNDGEGHKYEWGVDYPKDHVYYDNKYNIRSILLDDDGCPYAFDFAYADDAQKAYNEFKNLYKGHDGVTLHISHIFRVLGLIFDDYEKFKNRFIIWNEETFEADNRCIPKDNGRFLSFEGFEKPKPKEHPIENVSFKIIEGTPLRPERIEFDKKKYIEYEYNKRLGDIAYSISKWSGYTNADIYKALYCDDFPKEVNELSRIYDMYIEYPSDDVNKVRITIEYDAKIIPNKDSQNNQSV